LIANVDKSEYFSQNRVKEYNPFELKLNLFTEKPVMTTHKEMFEKSLTNN
jgi:hypothetical protein